MKRFDFLLWTLVVANLLPLFFGRPLWLRVTLFVLALFMLARVAKSIFRLVKELHDVRK